ncbi:hypothetical protein LRR81_18675 [Metabacillus sp. GX 13764]|uniref:hypothetical protein n=1 Tax=Metabacillus kandeliae TaxID=2900151 RepID=UPI001E3FFFC4|nr:hypothetical protein [Metabacillus kandeliae]MCD7036273.1 hypothetical protein [Metabacillus kandeliae]
MKSIIKSVSLGMLLSFILFFAAYSILDNNYIVGLLIISLLLGAVIGLLGAIYNKLASFKKNGDLDKL